MEEDYTFELSPKKIGDLNHQPIIETKMFLSQDGQWFIHKTMITDIKAVSYVEKVMDSD